MSLYFPKVVEGASAKEFYSLYKQRLILALDEIIDGTTNDKEIKNIEKEILLKSKPQVFTGVNSFEIKLDKQFNELTIFIGKQIGERAKDLTVFEFYGALEYIEKSTKK